MRRKNLLKKADILDINLDPKRRPEKVSIVAATKDAEAKITFGYTGSIPAIKSTPGVYLRLKKGWGVELSSHLGVELVP
jgi:hypothetical protein